MAAEAALSFAVTKLGEAAIQKVGFLRGVEGDVQWLKDELRRMQSFLKDAYVKQANDDESIRNWISDIRDVAQDAADSIETFNLKVDDVPRSRSRHSSLKRYMTSFPSHVYQLNKLGKEIKSIRARLDEIDKSRVRYGIKNQDHLDDKGTTESIRRRRNNNISVQVQRRRRLLPQQTDKDVVGFERDVEALLGEAGILNDDDVRAAAGLSIARITGMGGLGKSTLARVLYNHPRIADHFKTRAWVVVSEEFDTKQVIHQLLLELQVGRRQNYNVEELSVEQLKGMLYRHLEDKEYFIVVDDVWHQQHWELLADAFPDKQDKTSRLLVTSRNKHVPSTARYHHVLKPLDDNMSWQLLLKKSFMDGNCPQELRDVGRYIMQRCGGLPLAITLVGGLLRKEEGSKSGWEKVLKGMNYYLGRNEDPNYVSVHGILELSYHDLPPHLKSCFLCLGFFEEDATIHAKKLIQVWIAEGLISKQRGDGQETMEDIAMSYLDELINLNMVQIKDKRKDGGVKNCQIHDLVRDLSIKKAKEEISFEILIDQGNHTSQSVNEKCRHCAIYCSNPASHFFDSSESMTTSNSKYLRSLFFHRRSCSLSSFSWPTSPTYTWKSFGLLRVLELKDFIWKMLGLRHLYTPLVCCKLPPKINSKSTLKNLQTLTDIMVDNWMVEHVLIHLTGLRKLRLTIDAALDARKLWNSLAAHENLECLHLLQTSSSTLNLDGICNLLHLTQLKLIGSAASTVLLLQSSSVTDIFPPNLSYLTLIGCSTSQDLIPILEKLPKLLYLKLEETGHGRKMEISPDGFPSLKVLCLIFESNLENIQVGNGGMQELKQLELKYCQHLKSLPKELALMPNLKELRIARHQMQPSCRREDFQNIPYVEITDSIDEITEDYLYLRELGKLRIS